MKSERVINVQRGFAVYSKFLDVWLQSDDIIMPGETREDALVRVNKELEQTADRLRKEAGVHQSRNEAVGFVPTISMTKENDTLAQMVADVYNCETIEDLQSYQRLAEQYPEIQAACDQQRKKLFK